MSDLKKIAAEMRRYGALDSTPQFVDRRVQRWADALDALAAQSEPVRDVVINADGMPALVGDADWHCKHRGARRVYAAPQPAPPRPCPYINRGGFCTHAQVERKFAPEGWAAELADIAATPECRAELDRLRADAAPPQPAVPKEFERALDKCCEAYADTLTCSDRVYATAMDRHKNARTAVLRLYALAAAPAAKVPDGMRLVPQQFVSHVLALEHNWTKLIPTPPEFCTGSDSEHWFKEAYRRCGLDLSNAKAMLNAAPEAGS